MTTYNTGNPIGSTDARDRLDNSENMDILENSTTLNAHADRLGIMRKTRKGMELEHDNQIAAHEIEHDAQITAHESEHDSQMLSFENDFDSRLAGMGFARVGTFAAGATLTDMRQTLLWEVSQGGDGREYGWTGSFLPSGKVVSAGSTPASTGGVGPTAWVDRTDVTLRSEINIVQKRFSCVADMVADTSLYVGQIVETVGYYNGYFGTAAGPKGSNRYEIVSSGVGNVDGGAFIALSNGLHAKGLFSGGECNFYQFGAKGDSITDDTLPCQNTINSGIPINEKAGGFVTSATLYLGKSTRLKGIGHNAGVVNSSNSTVFLPNGDFPCFKDKVGEFTSFKISGLMISYGAMSVAEDNRRGFLFNQANYHYNSSLLEDICVKGGSYAIYDDSFSWLSTWKNIFSYNTRYGFWKTSGTTFTLEGCYHNGGIRGGYFAFISSLSLINFACDALTIPSTTFSSDFITGVSFRAVTGLNINGLRFEANNIGEGACLLNVRSCCGVVNGLDGTSNVFNTATGKTTYIIQSRGTPDGNKLSITGGNIGSTFGSIIGTGGSLIGIQNIDGVISFIEVSECILTSMSGGTGVSKYPFYSDVTNGYILYKKCVINSTIYGAKELTGISNKMTPTVHNGTTEITPTWINREAAYSLNNDVVTFSMRIKFSDNTLTNNQMYVPIPYGTVNTSTGYPALIPVNVVAQSITIPAGSQVFAFIDGFLGKIQLILLNAGVTSSLITPASGTFYISGSYIVN